MELELKTPKSVSLTRDELKWLRKHVKQFDTRIAAAISLGIGKDTLERVLMVGSGSPKTIESIRSVAQVTQNY